MPNTLVSLYQSTTHGCDKNLQGEELQKMHWVWDLAKWLHMEIMSYSHTCHKI